MILLYKTGIFLYTLFVHIASLVNEKAKLWVKGRKNWKKRLSEKIDKNARYIWVHCASLGEFEQGRPLIEEIKKQHPEYEIVLTFFSPSGYEIRKNYEQADVVFYLPADTKQNAQAFLNLVNPEKVFFIKYEYWYFYIAELKKRAIPLYIISAIFRESQPFFKTSAWGKWYCQMLFQLEHIFVQNETSAQLLTSIGVHNFTVAGDTRFDRVASIATGSKKLPIVEKFKGNSSLVIAGSTWKPDEELLITFINQNPDTKFIIAPHEVSAANINRLHQMLKTRAISFSKIENAEIENYQVLIIDSIGLLSSLYRYGNIAYIGGGFGIGIHNILEAATFGLPIIFGPNYKRFKEAVDLIDLGGAFSISEQENFDNTLTTLLLEKHKLKNTSEISRNYVAKNVGSTRLILNKVFNK
ncbi:MAG TPA: glycosyltransferase N-terminal domain-containing protein [Draconibacterium sp.]|nr:glycosyltransferase N-terminal domain-containing protein [Draconibacterium sp.]